MLHEAVNELYGQRVCNYLTAVAIMSFRTLQTQFAFVDPNHIINYF